MVTWPTYLKANMLSPHGGREIKSAKGSRRWLTTSLVASEGRQISLLAPACWLLLKTCHSDIFPGLLYRDRMAHNPAFSRASFKDGDLFFLLGSGDIKSKMHPGSGCCFLGDSSQSTRVCISHTCTSLHCPVLIIGSQTPHEHWAEKQSRENRQALARPL